MQHPFDQWNNSVPTIRRAYGNIDIDLPGPAILRFALPAYSRISGGYRTGKDGEIISRKGTLFDRDKFGQMLSEFYDLRGWDRETGFQKKEILEQMGLDVVAGDLAAMDLVK